jgi:hypothetical protein
VALSERLALTPLPSEVNPKPKPIAGVSMSVLKPFSIGDLVEVDGKCKGKV